MSLVQFKIMQSSGNPDGSLTELAAGSGELQPAGKPQQLTHTGETTEREWLLLCDCHIPGVKSGDYVIITDAGSDQALYDITDIDDWPDVQLDIHLRFVKTITA